MTDTTEEPQTEEVVDEARVALLEAMSAELGDALVDSHLIPGKDLIIRVTSESWGDTAAYLRERQRFRYFNFLSAIDWLPSPFGRSMDSEVDKIVGAVDGAEDEAGEEEEAGTGYAGGDTRFQMLARVNSLTTLLGVTVKADVPDDDLTVATWTGVYPGADWHEREMYEMYGISFAGHPGLRNLYLPGDFEGHPLRKDFPLLARIVKPWPGIVDVEPMPEAPTPPANDLSPSGETPVVEGGPSTTNPEDAS